MMNKKRTRTIGHLKYALFVPLAAALLIASNISCVSTEEEETLQVCEQMPEYPGGVGELMKFLSTNVKYPVIAQENEIQGRVIVQFVVKKDGSIEDVQIAKGVDPVLDKEALRVISSMPKWTPGKQDGKAVNVKYTVPVMFRLQGDDIKEVKDKEGNTIGTGTKREAKVDENGVYMVCDEMPNFPGGMRECMNFLSKNVNYPEDCEKAGIQGRVIVQFVVDKDGTITEPKVARGVHESLDKEALRIIKMMPKWTPGKLDGKAVSVKYTIPVMFRLQ